MIKEQKEEIEFTILKIKECSYLNKKIISINNQLEEINNSLIGVSSPAVKPYIIENKKPYTHSGQLELIMREEELIKQRDRYAREILAYEYVIESLEPEVKEMVIDLYILRKRHEEVAKKHYFDRRTMYRRINADILKNAHCDTI